MSGPWAGRELHLIGVGGAGMSGYATAAVALGASVSGSDQHDGRALDALRDLGVAVHVGHAAANVPAGDAVEVVYSSAVPEGNPERVAARDRRLREVPRAALLGELSALKRTIAVAGAHGKTTTQLDGRPRARPGRPAARLPHRRRAAQHRPQRGLGRGSGSWSRPTSPTARCSPWT